MNRLATLTAVIAWSAICGIVSSSPSIADDPSAALREIALKSADLQDATKVSIEKTASSSRRVIPGSLDVHSRRLATGSRFQSHTLSFARGQRVTIDLMSSDFDPVLAIGRLTTDGIQIIATDDDGGDGLNARIDLVIDEPGAYALIAAGHSSQDLGRYELRVATSHGRPTELGSGRAITTPLEITGRLVPGQQATLSDGSLHEVIEFDAVADTRLALTLRSRDFDAYLILAHRDSSGRVQVLAEDDDGAGRTDSRIIFDVPRTGRYLAVVNTLNAGESGAYRLTITSQPREGAVIDDFEARYPGNGSPDERYAVLVGVDLYPGAENNLLSCVNDTQALRDVLIEVYRFRPENIVLIHNEEATREHIMAAFRRHLGQAGPRGGAFFYFSGHGSQIPDIAPYDEEDGLDEVLCLWSAGGQGGLIIDDELNALIAELNTERVVVMLDMCHAGTGTLGAFGVKAIDLVNDKAMQDLFEVPKSSVAASRASRAVDTAGMPTNHVAIVACAPHESALAGPRGGLSVFTEAWVTAVRELGPDASFDAKIRRTRELVERFVTQELHRDDVPIPSVEGVKLERPVRHFLGAPR